MTRDSEAIPQDLADALATSEAARATWARLPPSHRREYLLSIEEAKRAETRAKRIQQAIARLEARGKDTRLSQLSTRPLAAKIGVRQGTAVTVLNAPRDASELLGELPEGASVTTRLGARPQFVLLFVRDSGDLGTHFARLRERLTADTTLWLAYPKRTGGIQTDLTRDRGWEPVKDAGYEGVTQVAVDDTWSAVRFKPVSPGATPL